MGEWTDAIAVLISNIESETKFTLSSINDDFKHSNPFDYNFREKLLNLINRRVCKVYDEFVLYLELKRLNDERKLSAKDDAIASFADWKQSTVWKVIPSQKRKNQDEIDTGNQTFLIKRPRFEVYEESSGDSSDEEIFEISDEETDLFDKENLIPTNSVAETIVQSSVDKIAGRPSESKLAKSTDYRKVALAFTPIDNGNQITAESSADRISSQRLNRILTQTSTPLPVPTKSVQPSIASIGNRDSSSTPVSSRITSSISPTSSHIPPLAPKTRVAPATALTEPSKLESDTSTTKDVSPAKLTTRASITSNQNNDKIEFIETSTDMTTPNETSMSTSTAPNGKKKFTCDHCEYITDRKYRIVRHEETHKKRPFQCPSCVKKFPSNDLLELHQMEHENPIDALFCEICQKKFSTQFNQRRHMQTIHK